ncbi:MAG: helix-turn-helix domain-containing protein [Gemmatimonadaceae bacterium]
MRDTTLGGRLRQLRHERGWTLAHLSKRTDLSVSYLNDIEHDRSVPALRRLVTIAAVLGTDVRGLLEGVSPYDK